MLTPEGQPSHPSNPFPHPFVKVSGGKYVESIVYNVETGKAKLCWPIDGKEMVATGGWSWHPVEPKVAAPESAPEAPPAEVSEPNPPAADSALASEYKRGPGRPRKLA